MPAPAEKEEPALVAPDTDYDLHDRSWHAEDVRRLSHDVRMQHVEREGMPPRRARGARGGLGGQFRQGVMHLLPGLRALHVLVHHRTSQFLQP
eukprot:5254855-Pyramimonas_sp.AAC.1